MVVGLHVCEAYASECVWSEREQERERPNSDLLFLCELVYICGGYLTGTHETFGNGWAIPCATDIAFSYLVARVIFGVGHPAIAFLLLLAIADDAAGLMILAVFYPQAPIVPQWLLLTAASMLFALVK